MSSANSQDQNDGVSTMSSIEDYRQQLQQQVTTERAYQNQPSWGSGLESLGAQDMLGTAHGDPTDLEKLKEAVSGPNLNPDPTFRVEALGQIVARSAPEGQPQIPLERLADPQESVQVRLGALGVLKQLAIASPTFSDWRPTFFEALRTALETPELRLAAFEVLTSHGDRYAQEQLVKGLADPTQALVAPADAFNLLSEDAHADVRELARQFVDQPIDEPTQQAAIRHLAGDPASVDRLRALITNPQQTVTTRKLAASALNALAPDALPVPETPASNIVTNASTRENADPVEDFLRILVSHRRGS